MIKIKLLKNAPKREEQFKMCCIGLIKRDFVYMSYTSKKKINGSEKFIGTDFRYENVVKNLETGGLCDKNISPGLIMGCDLSTDFQIFIEFKERNTSSIMKRCFAEVVDGFSWLKDVGVKEKYLTIKNAGLCWDITN